MYGGAMKNAIIIAVASAVISGLLCFLAAWNIQSNIFEAEEAKRKVAEGIAKDQQIEKANDAATGHEKTKIEIRTKFLTVTETVEKIIEKPVYRADCFDDDGMRSHADAVKLTGNTSEPSYSMPTAPTPQQ